MTKEYDNLDLQSEINQVSTKQIIVLGVLTLLTILAPALLHTNQY